MAVKGAIIEIRRSELHTVQDHVPMWEIPVIEAVHALGIKLIEEKILAHVEAPEAGDEYTRLENRYRRSRNEDGSQGIPVVAQIYGMHAAGVQALGRAIDSAKLAADSLV